MSYRVSGFNIVFATTNGVRTIGKEHPSYLQICRALERGDLDSVPELLDVRSSILKPIDKLGSAIELHETKDGSTCLKIDGLSVTGRVKDLILGFKNRGIPFTAIKNFWEKLQKNPLLVGKEGLMEFLAANDIPLLPNGNFLAYKGVLSTNDPEVFASTHDPAFLYRLGHMAYIDREQCTVDVDNCCGPGLHVGGFVHASGYGNTMLDCEVDPSDVTSVPKSENSKLRACRVMPLRVNKERTRYVGDYLDVRKSLAEICDTKPSSSNSVCADTKLSKKPSGGRTPKKTWYKMSGNHVVSKRRVLCPGSGWTTSKPSSAKRLALTSFAKRRTWYRQNKNGSIDRVRAITRPQGFSASKPKE